MTDQGSVVYRAEQDHCRRFPGPASADLRAGPQRNFQILNGLDFLAEVTQHIPNKGEHLIRYNGWHRPPPPEAILPWRLAPLRSAMGTGQVSNLALRQ
ncbi:transposase [Planctomycetota bacterium]